MIDTNSSNEIEIDSSNCKFDISEYNRLNNELLERMRGIFTHGFTLISMVGLLWTITATLITRLSIDSQSNSGYIIFAGLIVFLFGAPVVVLYPFSVKHQDNLRLISNIGAYTKVFFEYPRLLGKFDYKSTATGNLIKQPRMSWESIHCGAKYGIKRLFSFEYGASSIISIILSAISLWYFSLVGKSICGRIWFLILGSLYLIFLMVLTVLICLNSRTSSPLENYSREYFLVYLAEAEKSNYLSAEETDFCIRHQRYILRRDEIVKQNFSKKSKKDKEFYYFLDKTKYNEYVNFDVNRKKD